MPSQLQLTTEERGASLAAHFVDVVLALVLPKPLTYRVTSEQWNQLQVGSRVVVPLGKAKQYSAIIVRLHAEAPQDFRTRYILDVLDSQPLLQPIHIKFWEWIAEYYCCTLGEVCAAALPAYYKLAAESKLYILDKEGVDLLQLDERQKEVVQALLYSPGLSLSKLTEGCTFKNIMPVVQQLYYKGFLSIVDDYEEPYRPKKIPHVYAVDELDDEDTFTEALEATKNAPRQQELILLYRKLYNEHGTPPTRKLLLSESGASAAALQTLYNKGILRQADVEQDRLSSDAAGTPVRQSFSPQQEVAYQYLKEALDERQVVLLHGVTGSGKTSLYIKLIDEALERGEQVLYLLPEIGLTTQLISRLESYYGADIGIYHSRFTQAERIEIWNNVRVGKYKIIMGVRAAIYLPYKNLKLVIVDEEHERTFKQFDPAPRYHARDAAVYLAYLTGAKTLLATATPSFESYYNASWNKYGLVELKERYGDALMPKIELANLTEERKRRSMKGHLTLKLYKEMEATLAAGKQVILFQNRRGFAPLLECTTCGHTPVCSNCDVSLTYHQQARELRCHYCGFRQAVPKFCSNCGQASYKMLGFGTEQIEEELATLFPQYTTVRMDQDTTRLKYSYERIIDSLERGDAQILVGTQMVTKGLDFEKVQLVGILNADAMLKYPNFRAVEHGYQLMSQVAGRAGRRQEQGKVIIQTSMPDAPVFRFLLEYDYQGFYKEEVEERLKFKYPPYYKLIKILLKHKDAERVSQTAQHLAEQLRAIFRLRVVGPEPPLIGRIRNQYLMQLFIKMERTTKYDIPQAKLELKAIVDRVRATSPHRSVRIIIDVDTL